MKSVSFLMRRTGRTFKLGVHFFASHEEHRSMAWSIWLSIYSPYIITKAWSMFNALIFTGGKICSVTDCQIATRQTRPVIHSFFRRERVFSSSTKRDRIIISCINKLRSRLSGTRSIAIIYGKSFKTICWILSFLSIFDIGSFVLLHCVMLSVPQNRYTIIQYVFQATQSFSISFSSL